ncbi:hypothetical protein D3C71_1529660 [compost metagenome]
MEDHAERIDDTASDNQPERDGGQMRRERLHHHDAAPAHGEIKAYGDPVVTAGKHAFEQYAADGGKPDQPQHGGNQRLVDTAHQERRVGGGDQYEDRRVVQPAQEPFYVGMRPDIIGEGHGKAGDKADSVNPGRRNSAEAAPDGRVKNQRRGAHQRKNDTHAVDDAIGDNLVKIILATKPPHVTHSPFPFACLWPSMTTILDRNKTAAS